MDRLIMESLRPDRKGEMVNITEGNQGGTMQINDRGKELKLKDAVEVTGIYEVVFMGNENGMEYVEIVIEKKVIRLPKSAVARAISDREVERRGCGI